ncbi:BTAD domain-containing putative transcriptional regulator, partial [Parafrankia sp. FMc6]|uniref:AfsR/SARP family transcriptional regulator n=1 Tax=Parafrankia soli TaxID=2599596 RepID=UPI0034D663B9
PSNAPAPADVDSPSEAQRRLEPDEPTPGGGGAAAAEVDEAPPPPPSAPAVAVPAASPRAPEVTTPLLLTLFGRWQLSYRPTPDSEPHTVEGIGIKGRELVAYLAAHTGWVRRDTLIEAVWPDDGEPRHRIDNRFYAALSPLRRALRRATDGAIDDLFEQNEGRWRLRTDLLTVDLWQIQDALEARRRATTTAQEIAAILPLTGLYTGHLATDLTGTWAEPPREHLRRQVTDALTSILASLSEATPEHLDLLDTLRRLDPTNEQIYCQIARTQAHLGHHDALTVTYGQLADALADLDQRPSADTDRLFQELMRGPQNSRSA